MSLRQRLDRLERGLDATMDHSFPRELLSKPNLQPKEAQTLTEFFEAGETEHARCMEQSAAAKCYRQQLTQLGLPQPESLRGIDVVEEIIRLADRPSATRQKAQAEGTGRLFSLS
jgi:hypothetical protein